MMAEFLFLWKQKYIHIVQNCSSKKYPHKSAGFIEKEICIAMFTAGYSSA